jgi:poly(hydroxyalkanoate) depolymerase family esterase
LDVGNEGAVLRSISDTIARLKRAQQSLDTHGTITDRLSTLSGFGSNPGALQARFYIPNTLPENAPLIVVLHGCTQTAAGYDHHSGWSRLADEQGFVLLFPQQERVNNPNLCFNWFLPADTRRGSGEALSVREMVEAMVVAHRLARDRIFVTGLSAGGAMACALLGSYPELFAGGGIIAGLPYGSATTVAEAFDRMRGHGSPSPKRLKQLLTSASGHKGPWPRVSLWQGTADPTVNASNAEAIAAQWRGVHGLSEASARFEVRANYEKHVWSNASGEPVIEMNLVAGMGHGTPVKPADIGAAGPYMMDVGISSTREIARFWRIIRTSDEAVTKLTQAARQHDYGQPGSSAPPELAISNAQRPFQPDSSQGVRKIIEDALKTAGLIK